MTPPLLHTHILLYTNLSPTVLNGHKPPQAHTLTRTIFIRQIYKQHQGRASKRWQKSSLYNERPARPVDLSSWKEQLERPLENNWLWWNYKCLLNYCHYRKYIFISAIFALSHLGPKNLKIKGSEITSGKTGEADGCGEKPRMWREMKEKQEQQGERSNSAHGSLSFILKPLVVKNRPWTLLSRSERLIMGKGNTWDFPPDPPFILLFLSSPPFIGPLFSCFASLGQILFQPGMQCASKINSESKQWPNLKFTSHA